MTQQPGCGGGIRGCATDTPCGPDVSLACRGPGGRTRGCGRRRCRPRRAWSQSASLWLANRKDRGGACGLKDGPIKCRVLPLWGSPSGWSRGSPRRGRAEGVVFLPSPSPCPALLSAPFCPAAAAGGGPSGGGGLSGRVHRHCWDWPDPSVLSSEVATSQCRSACRIS